VRALSDLTLIAACPQGLESLVAYELKQLGYEPAAEIGRVLFRGDERAVCRANLWLRTADRILIRMGEFSATTFEELFERTKALPWADWIPVDGSFPVNGRSQKSQLSSVPACQAIVKKAAVESLKQRYGADWFAETGARFTIEVSLLKDVATLTLDTTGLSLHKRGYRKQGHEAPIKETLAAALVLIARWYWDRPLYDPVCGTGTIPIEAALIGHNLAPGLHRSFAAGTWPTPGPRLWEEARAEAHDLALYDRELQIAGSDIDPAVIALAQQNARAAGVGQSVRLSQVPLTAAAPQGEYGFLLANPPYGERIGEEREVLHLYRDLGALARRLPTWGCFVLTANQQFERAFGQRAEKKRKLYNGRIECQYYQYPGPRRPRLSSP
jgi:putative N6-adenine-specific DNA methylase